MSSRYTNQEITQAMQVLLSMPEGVLVSFHTQQRRGDIQGARSTIQEHCNCTRRVADSILEDNKKNLDTDYEKELGFDWDQLGVKR